MQLTHQSTIHLALIVPSLLTLIKKESIKANIFNIGHCLISCIFIQNSSQKGDQLWQLVSRCLNVNSSKFQEFQINIKLSMILQAFFLMFQSKSEILSIQYLLILVHYLVQETIICIVTKNQKMQVLWYNFAIIFFNFGIQETYELIKFGIGPRDESQVQLITLGASEMFMTSSLQILIMAILYLQNKQIKSKKSSHKLMTLCDQLILFLSQTTNICLSADSLDPEELRLISDGCDEKKIGIMVAKYFVKAGDTQAQAVQQPDATTQSWASMNSSEEVLIQGYDEAEYVFDILFKNEHMDLFENEKTAKLKRGNAYLSQKLSTNLFLDQIGLISQNNNHSQSVMETIIQFINQFEEIEAIGENNRSQDSSSRNQARQEDADQLTLTDGIITCSNNRGDIQKVLKLKNGLFVKLSCQIQKTNNIMLMKYEKLESLPERLEEDKKEISQSSEHSLLEESKVNNSERDQDQNQIDSSDSYSFSELVQKQTIPYTSLRKEESFCKVESKQQDKPRLPEEPLQISSQEYQLKRKDNKQISQVVSNFNNSNSKPQSDKQLHQYNEMQFQRDRYKQQGKTYLRQDNCVNIQEIVSQESRLSSFETMKPSVSNSSSIEIAQDTKLSKKQEEFFKGSRPTLQQTIRKQEEEFIKGSRPKLQHTNSISLWSANQEFSDLVLPLAKPCLKKASSQAVDNVLKSEETLKQKLYLKEMQSLQQQVNTNRIFLDMVVHDMRNPTSSIEFGLQEMLHILESHFDAFKALKKRLNQLNAEELQVDAQSQELEDQQIVQNEGARSDDSESDQQIQQNPPQEAQGPQIAQGQQDNNDADEQLDDINDHLMDQLEVCDELEGPIQPINIPLNCDKINSRNYKVMKNVDQVNEPVIIDRVVFKLPPHVNRIDRSVQVTRKTRDAGTQTKVDQKLMVKMQDTYNAKCSSKKIKEIIIMVEQYLERDICRKVSNLLKNSMFSASMVKNLINDLLDLAKLETQKFNFNNEYFNLKDAIKNAIYQVTYLASQRNIKICHKYNKLNQSEQNKSVHEQRSSLIVHGSQQSDLQCDLSILKNVFGDQRRVIQIIYNFLSNAIKFSNQDGTVEVIVTLVEEQDIVSEVAQEALKSVIDQNISQKKDKEKALLQIQESCDIQGMLRSKSQTLMKQKSFMDGSLVNKSLQCKEVPQVSDKSLLKYVRDHSQKNLFAMGEDSDSVSQSSQKLNGSIPENQDLQKSQSPSNKAWVLGSNSTLKDNSKENSFQEKYIKLKIDIVDSGVGIKEENLGKLFMNFSMLDEHSKMNAQGTGLGLSICKRMIEQMGGTVTVASKVNQGTTFTINLVTKAQYQQSLGEKLSKSSKSLMGLEDANDPENCHQVKVPLSRLSFSFDNGSEQVDKSGSSEAQIKARKSSKKLEEKEEIQIINQNLKNDSKNGTHEEALSCIVANDNQFQMMAVVYNLEALKLNVLKQAFNGLEALQFVQNNKEHRLDFILLDLDMPIMNGFDACKQIKSFYSDQTKLFKPDNKDSSNGSCYNASVSSIKSPATDKIIDDIYKCPMLIAFSGLVNDQVEVQAKEAGFQIIIESPLTQQKINDVILRVMEERNLSRDVVKSVLSNDLQQYEKGINRLDEYSAGNSHRGELILSESHDREKILVHKDQPNQQQQRRQKDKPKGLGQIIESQNEFRSDSREIEDISDSKKLGKHKSFTMNVLDQIEQHKIICNQSLEERKEYLDSSSNSYNNNSSSVGTPHLYQRKSSKNDLSDFKIKEEAEARKEQFQERQNQSRKIISSFTSQDLSGVSGSADEYSPKN